ncbi:MAG: transcriptional regulator, winged helix family, partial [Ilumatobacteraceae bacterium]|nr:transcriptional regulator, winged helix family [Ilumatobacteraceae bacterium]
MLHGDQVSPVVPRMLRSLLGLLVVHANRVVSADRLIDDLWQDDPPAAPAASLQAYVSNLRRLLEPHRPARTPATVLVTKDPGYSLRLDPTSLDLTEFEMLVELGRDLIANGDHARAEEMLGSAAGLWSGAPFAELSTEPWAQSVAVRLTELHAAAVEDRMATWLALGRHEAAVGVLLSTIDEQPWRERGWELLLVALYRSQRQADALR